jgi:hypothetical protein
MKDQTLINERHMIMNSIGIAVNVNEKKDLLVARNLIKS